MVVGIHCRGEDLAYFPLRRFFPTTFVYICSENAVHIGGFYFMRLRAACYYETDKSSGFPRFVRLNFVVECKVKESTTVR